MSDDDILRPFNALLTESMRRNTNALKPVMDKARQGNLTAEEYKVFRANFITRTMFTLPEVMATGTQASIDLRPLATTYSALTAVEEAGGGNPELLHPRLMMQSFNSHGTEVFGLEPFDDKEAMKLIRLLYKVYQIKAIERTATGESEDDREVLKQSGVVNIDGLKKQFRKQAVELGLMDAAETDLSFAAVFRIEAKAVQKMQEMGVTTETIAYGLDQFDDMHNDEPGYLQGVAFAHEGTADNVMLDAFLVMYPDRDKYKHPENFMKLTYPYFGAHGDYLSMAEGKPVPDDGVEAVHGQREAAKVLELPPEEHEAAMEGAKAFVKRNETLWHGLTSAIQSVASGNTQYTLRTKAAHAL